MSEPLTDPVVITDQYVGGVGEAYELEPGLYRVKFYARNQSFGSKERQVVAAFIMTAATFGGGVGCTRQTNPH